MTSSRSTGVLPPTRMTAGWRRRPATLGGVVIVPARVNPLAGMVTSASVEVLRVVCARVATLAASSRAATMPADNIEPHQPQLVVDDDDDIQRGAGVRDGQLESPRRDRACGPAERLLGHRADGGLHLGLRDHVERELGPDDRNRQPRRQRFIAGEDVVGHHDGAGADLVLFRDRPAGLRDLVDGGGHAERRGERDRGFLVRASSFISSGCQSGPYFISKRVTAKSKGAPVAPVDVMIQPEEVRASEGPVRGRLGCPGGRCRRRRCRPPEQDARVGA